MIKAIFPSRREGDEESEPVVLKPRGIDGYGSGKFGSKRGNKTHRGSDFKAPVSTIILSIVNGVVTKHGFAYEDDLSYRYIEVTDSRDRRHRFFYVDPAIKVGTEIKIDDPLGLLQNISARYNTHLMNNHVHYEIMNIKDEYLNPEKTDNRD